MPAPVLLATDALFFALVLLLLAFVAVAHRRGHLPYQTKIVEGELFVYLNQE